MDKIIKSFLKEFSENFQLSHKYNESDRFEFFSIFCALYNEYRSTSFELHDFLTGKGTQGIDGLSIIVNNKICNSIQEIDDLIDINGYMDVTFILIQSKTSEKFDGADIGNFFDWTKHYFAADKNLFTSTNMQNFLDMKEHIYNKSNHMINRNPYCRMYYVTSGTWNKDDTNLSGKVNQKLKELKDLNLFENNKIEFHPCGIDELRNLYRKTKEKNEVNIKFEKRTSLSDIPDVKVAYSGLLPFHEFKKIIIDDNDNIRPVFDDNIRDFLETSNNEVNSDIEKSLKSNKKIYFSLMNNGVTVVAEDVNGPSDNISIQNYQIVNGCQTSHVLFKNRHNRDLEELFIPIKIIATNNHQIKSEITRATNNQTAVSRTELEALTLYQKKLEDFYKASGDFLYYERRTNQYKNSTIEKNKIINIEMQVKVYTSMVMDKPHVVTSNYGKLLKDFGQEIFNPAHSLLPYYVSAYMYSIFLDLYNSLSINEKYWKFRFHLIMLCKYIITGKRIPVSTKKKVVEGYCNEILFVLNDERKYREVFTKAIRILEQVGEEIAIHNDRKAPELKTTTDILLDCIKKEYFLGNEKKVQVSIPSLTEQEISLKENKLIQKSLFEL
jgi:hypothetical protein